MPALAAPLAEPAIEAPACSRFSAWVVCCSTALALFWAVREVRFAMPTARLPVSVAPFGAPGFSARGVTTACVKNFPR